MNHNITLILLLSVSGFSTKGAGFTPHISLARLGIGTKLNEKSTVIANFTVSGEKLSKIDSQLRGPQDSLETRSNDDFKALFEEIAQPFFDNTQTKNAIASLFGQDTPYSKVYLEIAVAVRLDEQNSWNPFLRFYSAHKPLSRGKKGIKTSHSFSQAKSTIETEFQKKLQEYIKQQVNQANQAKRARR